MTRTVIMASLATLYWHPPLQVGSDNVLPPCPDTPNCVSTEATRSSQRVPTVSFTDTPVAALARAKAALLAEPRTTITAEREGYLHAECKSLVFRFVDDVDIVVDPVAHVYRFRSASRLGRSDLGVNRKRIARLSARLALPATTSN
ncbi:DUF1499 domain-containing protein [Gemmatimonas groenlandica]|uniref:DUF1499 domain-containing protein n=1 Tax=Gemmatimonas groenlandica TaxID=2732249 RepID=A0A6M4ILY8_9BACT|nr:DUF1499 domain-containing protein [Gemmatimonas groenlandica]QJR35680.1 DUF1499 domain-containing protein [Gemmatimonas groenlandica]